MTTRSGRIGCICGGLCQFKPHRTEKVSAVFGLHVVAYNLIRHGNLPKPVIAAS